MADSATAKRRLRRVALILVVLTLAACGSTTLPTPAASQSAGLATVPPASPGIVTAAPTAGATLGPPSAAPTAAPTAPPTATPPPATPPPTPTPSPAFDPCTLFTTVELEEIVRHAMLTTARVMRSGQPIGCRWEFYSGNPSSPWELDLGITRPGGRAAFDLAKPFAADGTPIPSLGDDSYPVIGNTIFALRGDTMVDVQYVNTGTDANRLIVPEAVIRLALERLPPP